MFPFNFQLSDDFCEVFGRKSFSVAMSNGRFLCLLKHLSEVSITKSNLVCRAQNNFLTVAGRVDRPNQF